MITARSLVKDYDGFMALKGISFELQKGEIFGVIGHNGAGKTTLLKIMAGLVKPTSGELSINGVDVIRDPGTLKASLGYLPEESRVYETMTVPDYLRFFGELYGLDLATIRSRQKTLLTALSLEDEGKKIGELSKGMRRKVAIARSLIHDPDLLIYDEPTSGLDPMTSRYISDYLRSLRDQQKTIVMSAHNLFQVEALCDHVMILRRGEIIAFGSMHELREQFGSLTYHLFFSLPPGISLDPIWEAVVEGAGYMTAATDLAAMNRQTEVITAAGGRVERIESHYPSLEEMLVKIGK
ncbi:ABC transporter ATP-binding protein [Methanosphaerula palustris]|uniref:ABC transporter related n=1 Tax=Methanosphaerula palustris (strain ATCC BAA-1556 / DSM 19958 / E1-9c) TaxID=521011 RepID=B8GII7_METPE|nr:ABC transporter ATP-binding protein [Methanosphaerula palustris]ACL15538.1 ABC transporter related [Methanosphaerula palustris E1-9c]